MQTAQLQPTPIDDAKSELMAHDNSVHTDALLNITDRVFQANSTSFTEGKLQHHPGRGKCA
ncbi:hypothetical protein O9992_01155 [Vibrio lentus]|nr:hypothetical protein [Vibrio lentus]